MSAILINTPIWVWVILVFLLYKGIQQLETRPIKLNRLFILPAIFLPLSILSVINATLPTIASIALVMGLLGGLLIAKFCKKYHLIIQKNNQLWQKGSYLPLTLYLFIFITRYIVSVLQHMNHTVIYSNFFNIVVGLPIGIGIGLLSAMPFFKKVN